jgi:hypothetical protein
MHGFGEEKIKEQIHRLTAAAAVLTAAAFTNYCKFLFSEHGGSGALQSFQSLDLEIPQSRQGRNLWP